MLTEDLTKEWGVDGGDKGRYWNFWKVFREPKEYCLAGGRRRTALSYSGRQIALIPEAILAL